MVETPPIHAPAVGIGIWAGRAVFIVTLIAACLIGFVESGIMEAAYIGDALGAIKGLFLAAWTLVTWGMTTLYLSHLIYLQWSAASPIDQALRSDDAGQEFVVGAILVICLVILYEWADRPFDPQGIDIAGLGLPFMVLSVLRCLATYRHARTINCKRPYVALLAGAVCVAILGAILHGLAGLMRVSTTPLHSLWLQTTVVATSVVAFMFTVLIRLGLEHGLTTVRSAYISGVVDVLRRR